MGLNKKLMLLSVTVLIILSFSSCIVRHNYDRKWYKHRTKVGRYHSNPTGGRNFWVRGRY